MNKEEENPEEVDQSAIDEFLENIIGKSHLTLKN
jgi:hypothetical protein